MGLEIVSSIKGLGIAGASGLLALLFPKYFGTVGQFVVKALCSIDDLPDKNIFITMFPESLKIEDGIILIKKMKERANELNEVNNTDYWTPRHMDKVLWTFGR